MYLGSGDFGTAYSVEESDEICIKITTDDTEYENAKKLVGQKFENNVDIYDVSPDDYVYMMEMLDIDPDIEYVFHELLSATQEQGVDYGDLDVDDLEYEISEEAVKLNDAISYAKYEVGKFGVFVGDIHSDNIGIKPSTGQYALFDHTTRK